MLESLFPAYKAHNDGHCPFIWHAGSPHLRSLLSCGHEPPLGTLLFSDCLPPGEITKAEKEKIAGEKAKIKAENEVTRANKEETKAQQGVIKRIRHRTQADKDKTQETRARFKSAREKAEAESVETKARKSRIRAIRSKLDQMLRLRLRSRQKEECSSVSKSESTQAACSASSHNHPLIDKLPQFGVYGFCDPPAPAMTWGSLSERGLSATAIHEVQEAVR